VQLLLSEEIHITSASKKMGVGRFGDVLACNFLKKKEVKRASNFERFDLNEDGVVVGSPDLNKSNRTLVGERVAVKQFRHQKGFLPPKMGEVGLHEIRAMIRLSGEGVVNFLGACVEKPNLMIVTELFNVGSFHEFVRDEEAYASLPIKDRLGLLHGAATGLKTIHDNCTVHGDIKSHNLLVRKNEATNKYSCAWGDLGTSIVLPSKDGICKIEQGTSGWTAPEVFTGEGYGLPADIFSFGILLCDASVVGGFKNQLVGMPTDKYVKAVKRGYLPHLQNDGTGVSELVEFCSRFDPKMRPTIDQVQKRLAEAAAAA